MSAIAYNPNYPIDDKRFVEAVRLLASNFAGTLLFRFRATFPNRLQTLSRTPSGSTTMTSSSL